MVLIIDYQMGNVGSVKNALDFLGVENKISNVYATLKALEQVSSLVKMKQK